MPDSAPSPPKKGAIVELQGLVAKPELNGCTGVVISNYDPKTERCGVKLDDGTGVNAKLANLKILDISLKEHKLNLAIKKLSDKGGTEDEDDEENDTPPKEYLDELIAVGDARYELGQYDKAGSAFYNAYYACSSKYGSINSPESYPVMHKMLQAWSKSEEEHILKMAHGMAQQTLMMPGAPSYIVVDKQNIEAAMYRKGI